LEILTGTGHHSFGGNAKLLPAIQKLAKEWDLQCDEVSVGGQGGQLTLFF